MHVYTGALKKAAENARKDGKSVGCSIVETFGKDATPQELSDVLRLEYRSKLLNPKWAKVNARETNKFAFPPIVFAFTSYACGWISSQHWIHMCCRTRQGL